MTTNFNHNQSRCLKKNITLTAHAIQRARERFNITSNDELKSLAANAKNKGIKIWVLDIDNYKKLGLTWNTYRYLKNKYAHNFSTQKSYYYKDKVFVFQGKNGQTLKTIVPCGACEIKLGCEKMDNQFKYYELEKIQKEQENKD